MTPAQLLMVKYVILAVGLVVVVARRFREAAAGVVLGGGLVAALSTSGVL